MDIESFVKDNKIRAAVFDMDGTLTNSMAGWNEIYGILSDYLGAEIPADFMMRVNHLPMQKRVGLIVNELSLEADVYAAYEFWVDGALEFYRNRFKIKPYMLQALKKLSGLGVRCAIATASDGRCAEAFIESNSIAEYIGSVTSLYEVSRPKSFPDVYVRAAEKLGASACECLVFEDALTALEAAKSGGFKVCGVQDVCSAADENQIKKISDITMGFEI